MGASSNAVLVVVDVQNGFIRPPSEHVKQVIKDLVSSWQAVGGDVVFTRYLNFPGSQFERLIHWTALQSAPETDIVSELQPLAEKATAILNKTVYSFFTSEGLKLVRDHGWTDIFVCGIATESCVLKTVVDAFELNLTPWLIQDASASHAGDEAHQAGLLVASRFVGVDQLINVADISCLQKAAAR